MAYAVRLGSLQRVRFVCAEQQTRAALISLVSTAEWLNSQEASQPWLPVSGSSDSMESAPQRLVCSSAALLLRCNLSASLADRSYGGLIASIRGAMYHRWSTGIGRSKSEARCAMPLTTPTSIPRPTLKPHQMTPTDSEAAGHGQPMVSPIQDKVKERTFTHWHAFTL